MDIQAIGSRAFSVYIGGAELDARRIDPRQVTREDARQLVNSVIRSDSPGAVSLELYPGRHELLIFVQKSDREPEFFRFEELESLLAALRECAGDLTASLYYYDGGYILSVWRFGAEKAGALWEFGTPLDYPADFLFHLREHGKLLAEGDAAEKLRATFSEE